MLAVSAASGLPAEIVLRFVDSEVNRLLDLDTRLEVSLCLVPIGRTSETSLPPPREAPALGLETIPLSKHEVEYPAMLEMHDASSLESREEVNQWRAKPPVLASSALTDGAVRLPRLPEEEQPKDTIEQVILRRGSTRTFDKAASITPAQLATILDSATRGLPADFLEPPGAQLNDLYLIVHSVQRLKPGAYFFRCEQNTLEFLKEGEFRAEAHHLGLEQDLPADACVAIFFLADLKPILERYGNRGYRAVQLEAGAIGGRIYLAAYAQHLGATGLTFFDDDVVKLLFTARKGQERHFPARDWQAAEAQTTVGPTPGSSANLTLGLPQIGVTRGTQDNMSLKYLQMDKPKPRFRVHREYRVQYRLCGDSSPTCGAVLFQHSVNIQVNIQAGGPPLRLYKGGIPQSPPRWNFLSALPRVP
jgi:SagB-type dehydrogenase family enzyme